MKLCSMAATVAVSASLLVGCGGSGLPDELSFLGQRVERARDWEMGSLRGVVLIPPGEVMETASLQLSIILGHGPYKAKELDEWLMEHYAASPTEFWLTWPYPVDTSACKIGRDLTHGRAFVAFHVCRSGPAGTAAVEADERLDDSVIQDCRSQRRPIRCWQELCDTKRADWLPALRAIADDVVRPPVPERARKRDRKGS